MFKNKKIILVLALALLLTGCTNPFKKSTEGGTETTGEGFSLKNALTLGKSMKCTFSSEWGETTSWVKGEKVKSEGTSFGPQGGQGGMINDGTWIYMWGETADSGMKYKVSALESMQKEEEEGMPSVQDFKDAKKWLEEMDVKYKADCKSTVISDNTFVPPSNIQFKDLTETFEKMQDWSESFDEDNSEALSEEKMEELQNLMKDFEGE